MPHIDFIYMINLDERPEKWESSLKALESYGIIPYRFSAVNGWQLSVETINDVGLSFQPGMKEGIWGTSYFAETNLKPQHSIIDTPGQVYFCHCMARGPIGIILSHLSILSDALQSNYETIWVMEDDIEIFSDPRELSQLIERLDQEVGKDGWDLLFTDRNTRNHLGEEVPAWGRAQRPNFNPSDESQYYIRKEVGPFMQIGARFGAYSYIARRKGIEKIFKFILDHSIFLPYDMEFHCPPGIRLFTVKENVVGHKINALSDNGGENYLNK